MVRGGLCMGLGVLSALLAPVVGLRELRSVVGWDVTALTFLVITWGLILRCDAHQTELRAAAEDPGRTLVWLLVSGASAFSLFASLVVMKEARSQAPALRDLAVGLGLLAVALSWLVTHTGYALRYAHLFYRDDGEGVGGLDFPGKAAPSYFDFAYFSFTLGMCFQVSDVMVSSAQIRHTTLSHALLSFVYNTTILAVAINLVTGMFAS